MLVCSHFTVARLDIMPPTIIFVCIAQTAQTSQTRTLTGEEVQYVPVLEAMCQVILLITFALNPNNFY